MDQSTKFDGVWSVIEQMRAATPILELKDPATPSIFLPENMLREARRQKNLADLAVPEICILDPDGDMLRQLQKSGRTTLCQGWPATIQ